MLTAMGIQRHQRHGRNLCVVAACYHHGVVRDKGATGMPLLVKPLFIFILLLLIIIIVIIIIIIVTIIVIIVL